VLIQTVPQAALRQVDEGRREAGRLLDSLGLGPEPTPGETRSVAPGVRLHVYGLHTGGGPPVLLVPAPIKRWYIWDLEPAVSVVARCLEAGRRVFLVEWTEPGPSEHDLGLEAYAHDLLLACLDAVAAATGERRVLLVGHSLGGTFAAICAARNPSVTAGVVLLEAPVRFGADAGAFAPLVAVAPHASRLGDPRNGVPGSFLDLACAVAAPVTFYLERWADLACSLPDRSRLRTHLRVLRWTLDEFTLTSRLFEDVVERLYRRDEFMVGDLPIGGRRVGPDGLTAPLLTVVNPTSRVIPARSVLPLHRAAPAASKLLMRYRGDIGVGLQHVGVLVGRNAHAFLWPQVLRWMSTRGARGRQLPAAEDVAPGEPGLPEPEPPREVRARESVVGR
jgi:polyhydroxyalkanoate synthase subunit PhaC